MDAAAEARAAVAALAESWAAYETGTRDFEGLLNAGVRATEEISRLVKFPATIQIVPEQQRITVNISGSVTGEKALAQAVVDGINRSTRLRGTRVSGRNPVADDVQPGWRWTPHLFGGSGFFRDLAHCVTAAFSTRRLR